MPTPRRGESEDAYVSRCMAHPHTQKYPTKQRLAVCYSMYAQHKDRKKGAK